MMSFYRRRSPLIASAKIISSSLQHSPSRSNLSAGKTTISSAFSVFSPIDVQRRFYHNGNFFHASQEPNRGLSPSLHGSPSRSNLSAGKTTICSAFSVFSPIDVQRRSYHHGNTSHSSQEPNRGLWQKALSFLPQLVVFTVPYTNRRRLITVPIKLYSEVSVWGLENVWSKLDSMPEMRRSFQFLPETDPQSVRVRWILRDIIDALHKDLKKNGVKAEHLDGLNWEVLVTSVTPFPIPLSGGKIVISTRFLRDFATDAEVATCIGHQVAQMVAGHHSEVLNLGPIGFILLFPHMIFSCLVPSIAEKIKQIVLTPLGKMGMEADYIGMILIALAGYDPQVAPSVYEKMGRLYPKGNPISVEDSLLSVTATGKERALKLAQFMEEAVNKYEEVKANYQILPRKMGGLKLIPKVKS
ncbi:hypothetical protein ACHQM5_014108 [Ranunculus cassubicifolius]